MANELIWDQPVHDIPDTGLSATREAAPDELERIAKALDLLACSRLVATYTITPAGSDRYHLVGRLQASLRQACVVTLDPVASEIDEELYVYFWPESDIPPPAGGELDLDEEFEPEPIVNGQIEIGRVVLECLAGAIDPFPRKSDAALDRASAGPQGETDKRSDSPFAVLAKIQGKA